MRSTELSKGEIVEVRSSRKSPAALVLGILATSTLAFLPASFPTTLVLVFERPINIVRS
jgi:hypothetical protein